LGEFGVTFGTALGYESGDQVGLIHEKISGEKSGETVPLNGLKIVDCTVSGMFISYNLDCLLIYK
jgi:hypothetical protein